MTPETLYVTVNRTSSSWIVPVVTLSQSAQLVSNQHLIHAPLPPPIVVLSSVLELLHPPADSPPQSFISSWDRELDTPLASLPELHHLVRPLLNSGYPIILPPSYTAFSTAPGFCPCCRTYSCCWLSSSQYSSLGNK